MEKEKVEKNRQILVSTAHRKIRKLKIYFQQSIQFCKGLPMIVHLGFVVKYIHCSSGENLQHITSKAGIVPSHQVKLIWKFALGLKGLMLRTLTLFFA